MISPGAAVIPPSDLLIDRSRTGISVAVDVAVGVWVAVLVAVCVAVAVVVAVGVEVAVGVCVAVPVCVGEEVHLLEIGHDIPNRRGTESVIHLLGNGSRADRLGSRNMRIDNGLQDIFLAFRQRRGLVHVLHFQSLALFGPEC